MVLSYTDTRGGKPGH